MDDSEVMSQHNVFSRKLPGNLQTAENKWINQNKFARVGDRKSSPSRDFTL